MSPTDLVRTNNLHHYLCHQQQPKNKFLDEIVRNNTILDHQLAADAAALERARPHPHLQRLTSGRRPRQCRMYKVLKVYRQNINNAWKHRIC